MMRRPAAADQLLFVEGTDDREFVYQLCNRHAIDNKEHFEVRASQGVVAALNAFETAARLKRERAIGLIVDADDDLGRRWQEVQARLDKLGHSTPALIEAGLIIEPSDGPRLGIWVMPDNTLPGALEDFASALVPASDALWPRARAAVADIPSELRQCRHDPKVVIHTWLAWQEEPGTPLGLALAKRYLDAEHAAAKRLADWLRRLFVEPRAPDDSR